MSIGQQFLVLLSVAIILLYGLLWVNHAIPSDTVVAAAMLSLPAVDFSAHINGNLPRLIIDIRTPEEYNAGHLPEAANVDFYNPLFTRHLDKLDRNHPIAIYCRSGSRTGEAIKIMEQMGFTDVVELQGGLIAWQEEFDEEVCSDGVC